MGIATIPGMSTEPVQAPSWISRALELFDPRPLIRTFIAIQRQNAIDTFEAPGRANAHNRDWLAGRVGRDGRRVASHPVGLVVAAPLPGLPAPPATGVASVAARIGTVAQRAPRQGIGIVGHNTVDAPASGGTQTPTRVSPKDPDFGVAFDLDRMETAMNRVVAAMRERAANAPNEGERAATRALLTRDAMRLHFERMDVSARQALAAAAQRGPERLARSMEAVTRNLYQNNGTYIPHGYDLHIADDLAIRLVPMR